MTEPIAQWEWQTTPIEAYAEGLIWWARLDNRYLIEVVSDPPSHDGILLIYDHDNENELLFRQPVSLAYGAQFGPDIADIAEWQLIVSDFVDGRDV